MDDSKSSHLLSPEYHTLEISRWEEPSIEPRRRGINPKNILINAWNSEECNIEDWALPGPRRNRNEALVPWYVGVKDCPVREESDSRRIYPAYSMRSCTLSQESKSFWVPSLSSRAWWALVAQLSFLSPFLIS